MNKTIRSVMIGGTYNPVHIGHMHLIDEIRHKFKPELILIIPSYVSAHKINRKTVDAEHRIKMLEIACKDIDVVIDKCEIERKGVSYSIDTIRYIKEKYDLQENPGLLIGDDLAEHFDKWKDPDKIADEAEIIIARRQSRNNELLNNFKYRYTKLENLMIDVSSTDIRNRLAGNNACRYLMPAGVFDYIHSNKLYGADYV